MVDGRQGEETMQLWIAVWARGQGYAWSCMYHQVRRRATLRYAYVENVRMMYRLRRAGLMKCLYIRIHKHEG